MEWPCEWKAARESSCSGPFPGVILFFRGSPLPIPLPQGQFLRVMGGQDPIDESYQIHLVVTGLPVLFHARKLGW